MSRYDIAGDTWISDLAPLKIARAGHSACVLKGMVYVFCGEAGLLINSIEMIPESAFFVQSTVAWELIEVP